VSFLYQFVPYVTRFLNYISDVPGDDPVRNSKPMYLLDGSNSTLRGVLMGVMVAAPSAEYPYGSIPPYSAQDTMCVDIIRRTFPSGDPSPEADSWLPALTTWDKAEHAWSSPPTDPQSIVDSWAEAFQWEDELVGAAPTLLLQNFKTVYLDIPCLTS